MVVRMKQFVESFGVRARFFRELTASARVLDLGCGLGHNARALHTAMPEIEIHGIDLVEPDKVPSFIRYQTVDIEAGRLPFPDAHFDAILFAHVIEHLRRPNGLGPELRRVLKSGGKIYVETPNWTTMFVPSFGFRRHDHNPFNFYDDPTHTKPWTQQGLFEFLSQSCGLQVQRTGSTRNWVRIPLDPFVLMVGLLTGNRALVVSSFWNIYGWCIYAVAIKGL